MSEIFTDLELARLHDLPRSLTTGVLSPVKHVTSGQWSLGAIVDNQALALISETPEKIDTVVKCLEAVPRLIEEIWALRARPRGDAGDPRESVLAEAGGAGFHGEGKTLITSATVSFAEAVEYLGVSGYMLRTLVHERRIRHIKLGGKINPRYRFRLIDLDTWLEEQAAASVAAPEGWRPAMAAIEA